MAPVLCHKARNSPNEKLRACGSPVIAGFLKSDVTFSRQRDVRRASRSRIDGETRFFKRAQFVGAALMFMALCNDAQALDARHHSSLGFASWQGVVPTFGATSNAQALSRPTISLIASLHSRSGSMPPRLRHRAALTPAQTAATHASLGKWQTVVSTARSPVEVSNSPLGRIVMAISLWLSVLYRTAASVAAKTSPWLSKLRDTTLRAITAIAAMIVLTFPAPSLAAQLCLPCPSLQGMGRVCVELRSDPTPHPPPSRPDNTPDYINAQRTPTGQDGNFLSRAGFRPQTMFEDGWAKIQAAARQRLEVMEYMSSDEARKVVEEARQGTPPGPLRRQEFLESGGDIMEAMFGTKGIPRSQLIAAQFDPVMVFCGLALLAIVYQNQILRMLRWVVIPHHRSKSVTIITCQVGLSGDDALGLSRSCRCLAQNIHDAISPIHISADGAVAIDNPRPGAGALSPTVRYASLLLNNATTAPGYIHGRVEVDSFPAREIADAREYWEALTSDEILRGLPKKEFPHKPGQFQYGSPNECPKPGPAGFGLELLPKWLDLSMPESKAFAETLWRLPRRDAPVGLGIVFPPLRNTQEQELLEDRRAANLDKMHRAQFGKSGGYLRRLQEERMKRKAFLETEEEWMAKNESDLLAQGPNRDDDEWVDIRKVDFAEQYTENYGSEWTQAVSQSTFVDADRDHNESVAELRSWYRREMGGEFNAPPALERALTQLAPDVKESSGVRVKPYLQDSIAPPRKEWTPAQLQAAQRCGLSDAQVAMLQDMDKFDPELLVSLVEQGKAPEGAVQLSEEQRRTAAALGLGEDELQVYAMLVQVAPELLQEGPEEEELAGPPPLRAESEAERERRMAMVKQLLQDDPEIGALDELTSQRSAASLWDKAGPADDMTVKPEDLQTLGAASRDSDQDSEANATAVEMESPELYAKSIGEMLQDAGREGEGGKGAMPEMLEPEDVQDGEGFKYTPGLQSTSRLGLKKFFKPIEEFEKEMADEEARQSAVDGSGAGATVDADELQSQFKEMMQSEGASEEELKEGQDRLSKFVESGGVEEAQRRAQFKVDAGEWEGMDEDVNTRRASLFDRGAVNRSEGMVLVTPEELLGEDAKKEDVERVGMLMLEEWQWEMLQYNPKLKARVRAQLLQRIDAANGSLTTGEVEEGDGGAVEVMLSNGTSKQEQAALDLVLKDLEELVTDDDEELQQGEEEEIVKKAKEGGWRQASPAQVGPGTGRMWVRDPHGVATLMLMLAQPDNEAAERLRTLAEEAEETQTTEAYKKVMEELSFSDVIPGNVIAVELLWTAEPEDGFELEDIMTRRRLQSLYPELFPEDFRVRQAAEEEEERRSEEAAEQARKAYAAKLARDKEALREIMGSAGDA